MVNEPPDYCPRCGTQLSPVDPPSVYHCPSCDAPVFHNPVPTTRVALIDGDSILLVKVDAPERDLWGTPGGLVEADEDPDVAGARELEEETTLSVDPDDLVLFDARTFPKFGNFHKTYLAYAVAAEDVTGEPCPDDEVVAARFWTRSEFATANDRLLTSWPETYKDLEWWIDSAQNALAQEQCPHH